MEKVAIFGAAGAIGRAVARELRFREMPFRAVGRNPAAAPEAFGDMPGGRDSRRRPGRSRQPPKPRAARIPLSMLSACRTHRFSSPQADADHGGCGGGGGSAHLARDFQRLQLRRARDAHRGGDASAQSATVKGRMRKEQEDIASRPQWEGSCRAWSCACRISTDPGRTTAWATRFCARRWRARQPTGWGRRTPHEFVYVPDTGPVIVDLASRDDCYGQSWNFAGPGEISGLAFIPRRSTRLWVASPNSAVPAAPCCVCWAGSTR